VHLLLATTGWIGDGGGVDVAYFFEQAIDTAMLVGDVEAARPTVVAVSGEASLGTWWVLVGWAHTAFIVVVLVVAVAVAVTVDLVAGLEFFDESRLLFELLVFGLGWCCDVIRLGCG
jgi:hypothetical protein